MEIPTLINAYSTVKGEMILMTDTRVDGKIFGKVETDHTLLIGKEGYFKGFLRARNLVVFGRVEGNFLVSGETIFHPGASIIGTLYTKLFDIREGANINARIETYEKSETLEEAQLYLEEELIQMQTPKSLDNDTEIVNGILSNDFSVNQENGPEHLLSVLAESDTESRGELEFVSKTVATRPETFQFLGKPVEIVIKPNRRRLNHTKRKIKAQPQENIREQSDVLDSEAVAVQNNGEQTIIKPIVKSALFSSLLENSVNESSAFFYNKSEDEEKPIQPTPAQTENNEKENTVLSYNELRDLLIHPKFPLVKTDEKLNGRPKSKSTMINEGEMNKEF